MLTSILRTMAFLTPAEKVVGAVCVYVLTLGISLIALGVVR